MPSRAFVGKRIMTNEDLRQEKYKDEIKVSACIIYMHMQFKQLKCSRYFKLP